MFSRGLSAFLGGFTLVNLLGGLLSRDFDCNVWWVDFRPLPAWVSQPILLLTALLLLAYAARPPRQKRQRQFTACAVGVVALVTLANAVQFYVLLARGRIRAGVPVPLSILLTVALARIAWRVLRPLDAPSSPRRGRLAFAAAVAACLMALPLAQMLFFGKTDYRRRADAVVVFGARAYADGRPSQALADRVRTACRLYHDGYAARLVFSGGPGDGPTDEPESMRRLALKLGVPDAAITLDPRGLNTEATVRNTDAIFRRLGARRVLAVSHAYHLPRVKMAYRRQGWDVYTVPAEETRPLTQMPFLVAREVAAVWAYYVRGR